MRRIRISYGVITEESARHGDYAETGWEDEEGVEIVPDEWDIDVYGSFFASTVEIAIKEIEDKAGAVEYSSSKFCKQGWYIQTECDHDKEFWETGRQYYREFHLDGFSHHEERAIYDRLK